MSQHGSLGWAGGIKGPFSHPLRRRIRSLGIAVLLLLAGAAPAWGDFPPLPSAAEREANNDAEREAGAVILEDITEISGRIESLTVPAGHRVVAPLLIHLHGGSGALP